jgi:hypothetical protein
MAHVLLYIWMNHLLFMSDVAPRISYHKNSIKIMLEAFLPRLTGRTQQVQVI